MKEVKNKPTGGKTKFTREGGEKDCRMKGKPLRLL